MKKYIINIFIVLFFIVFWNVTFAFQWTSAIWVKWWYISKLKEVWKITFPDWTINFRRIYDNKKWINTLLKEWKFYWWDLYYNND